MSTSFIQKVEKTVSLRERIWQALSTAIISGELAPGAMVSVPSLAAEFGVSATPVREAVLDLEQRGFVQSVANKGFRVTEVSRQDLEETIEVRRMLEAPIMAALAGTIPAADMANWRRLADRISEYADAGNLTAFVEADREFHLGLLALYGNARLVAVVTELRSQTRMVGLAKMTNSPELSTSAGEHHEMLDLIEQGDGLRLEELMGRHFAHILTWWGPTVY